MNTGKLLLIIITFLAFAPLWGEDADDYEILMNDALTYLEQGDTNSSIEVLRSMKKYFGEDKYITTVYGVNLLVGGYGEEAQKIFDKEDNPCSQLCRAVLLARRAKYPEAIEAFKPFEGRIANYNVIIDFLKTMEDADFCDPDLPVDTLPAIELHAYWNMLRDNISDSLKGLREIEKIKGRDIYKDTKGIILAYDYKKPIFFNAFAIRGRIGLEAPKEKADYVLEGRATIRADIGNNDTVKSAMLYIDGKMKSMTNSYPFSFVLNTANIPNGVHDVKIAALDAYGNKISEKRFTAEIFNKKDHKAPDEELIWQRLTEFVTPRQGMESVNYLMAVCAAREKDIELHRKALERTVAVNPQYRDASELLRRYYFLSDGATIIEKGNPARREIALTFDDGPTPTTLDNLKILKKYNVRATFFIVGRQAEKYPEIIRAIMEDGHQLALHSQNHPDYTKLDYNDIVKETLQCYCAIKECGGDPTLYFRPPGGNRDEEQSRLSREYGVRIGLWTKNSTHLQESTPELLTEYCNQSMKPGFIYLLHNDVVAVTQSLPAILDHAASEGFRCVTMEEIIK
ncbi:MAG: polysaccharide deacetylase family protein [Abditibacteriota bacterium]|nr:polysaccharide deacetylase family protein [Abditibacteriota bacterium]